MIFVVLLFFKKIWAFWVKIQKAQIFMESNKIIRLQNHIPQSKQRLYYCWFVSVGGKERAIFIL